MLDAALEQLIRPIVNHPKDVNVQAYTTSRGTLLQVIVNPEDMGRIIGKNGRVATALRNIIQAVAHEHIRIDISDID